LQVIKGSERQLVGVGVPQVLRTIKKGTSKEGTSKDKRQAACRLLQSWRQEMTTRIKDTDKTANVRPTHVPLLASLQDGLALANSNS